LQHPAVVKSAEALPPTGIKLTGVLMRMFTHHLDRDSYWWSILPISIPTHCTKDRANTEARSSITHWGAAVIFPAIWSEGQGRASGSGLAKQTP